MSPSIDILRTTGRQTERMGQAMARAFRHEPNFAYMLPDHDERERALAWFFGSFVARLGLRYGEVYTTPGATGGAVWMRPGTSASPWGALRAGLLAMPLRLGLGGARRSAVFGAHIERTRQAAAPPLHWYLVALGVDPSEQGQGLGGALLQPVLTRADADGVPCYLETFRERTATFYSRFGFGVVRTDAVPGGGPPFWCMMRKPHDYAPRIR